MRFLFITIVLFSLSSCFRLDSFMYNNDSTITEYKLDDFDDEQDFILDDSYNIPDDKIQLFTLSVGAENHEIYCLYIGNQNTINTDTVIFYNHGNKDHMDFYWQRAKLLAHTGGKMRYGVMMIDYKGYGLSGGQSSEAGLVEDTKKALSWLYNQGLRSDRLIMYGFSLGTCPAITIAGDASSVLVPARLIAEAPFASTDVMAADGALLDMPGAYYTSDRFENAEYIKNVEQPFLWIHGTADDFLNIKTHGEVVYKNYTGLYGQAERVIGAGHSTVPQTIGFLDYNMLLESFITKKI